METAQHKPLMAEEPTTLEGEQVLDALCSVSFDPRYLSIISTLTAPLCQRVCASELDNWEYRTCKELVFSNNSRVLSIKALNCHIFSVFKQRSCWFGNYLNLIKSETIWSLVKLDVLSSWDCRSVADTLEEQIPHIQLVHCKKFGTTSWCVKDTLFKLTRANSQLCRLRQSSQCVIVHKKEVMQT